MKPLQSCICQFFLLYNVMVSCVLRNLCPLLVRSDGDGAWPLERAAEILRLLDGARDLLLTPGGGVVHRVEALRGFEFSGVDAAGAQVYAAEFRVVGCGE